MKDNILLAGAAPDTGNLGVSALCRSAATLLKQQCPGSELYILDHGETVRRSAYPLGAIDSAHLLGLKYTRNFLKPSSYQVLELQRKLNLNFCPQAEVVSNARIVFDVSGGDSFTDLYGLKRFRVVELPKLTAIKNKIPLVLLPQTYGPFRDEGVKKRAQKIVRAAHFTMARDLNSFEIMKDLLGSSFDRTRHLSGVDLAFALQPAPLDQVRSSGLLPQTTASEVFGFNISGLIYNSRQLAADSFGITMDYAAVHRRLIQRILDESDGVVWLVPHVLAKDPMESDLAACEALRASMSDKYQSRISIVRGQYDEQDIKAVIGQCTWFCGTRMHATIAGLSRCVPTSAIAYSDKTLGVFESVGQADRVVDARKDDEGDLLEKLYLSWRERDQVRKQLCETMPRILDSSKKQLETVTAYFQATSF